MRELTLVLTDTGNENKKEKGKRKKSPVRFEIVNLGDDILFHICHTFL